MSSAFSSCKLASVLSTVLCDVFPGDACSLKLWSDSTGTSNWTIREGKKKRKLSKMHTKAYSETMCVRHITVEKQPPMIILLFY